jgi:alpha-galactosidase
LEGGTFAADVNSELDQVLVSSPVDGSSPVPWMAIQVGQAHGLYVGWEFSGIGRIHAAAKSAKPLRFDLRVGLVPEFKTDVLAGETFLVPPAFVGCYRGDIDDGSYTLHRFVLDKLLPPFPQDQPYPTLAYNLYLDHATSKATTAQAPELVREADVLRSAALAKELGFETFVPDAMWFPQSGDWRWDPARFPRGEQPIEEYVHQNGMRMGLWCAWTHGAISDSPEALGIWQHPDWFVPRPEADVKPEYLNWDKLIDLSSSPAKEWVQRKLQQLVSEYKLDYLKHDYSPIVTTCEQTNHRHKYGVDVSYWSTLGYYEVQEALKQKFPALVLEGCSGGGHIKDFGYIRRVHYIVTTDTLADLPDRQSIYDSTFALPPAVLMAYTYDNQYQGQFTPEANRPEPFLWRSAMMGAWQIDPTDTATWTVEERARLKRSTEVYKSWIRPILGNAKVHHILPRPDGYHWDGMFYWNPSLKRGIVYVFRPNNDEVFQRIRLKGLAASAHYRAWSEEGSVAEGVRTGAELMNAGLRAKLPGKFTSDLIYLESKGASTLAHRDQLPPGR